jgi:hypothetical protein
MESRDGGKAPKASKPTKSQAKQVTPPIQISDYLNLLIKHYVL